MPAPARRPLAPVVVDGLTVAMVSAAPDGSPCPILAAAVCQTLALSRLNLAPRSDWEISDRH